MRPAIIAGVVVVCVAVASLACYLITRPLQPAEGVGGGGVTLNNPTGTTENSTTLTWSQYTDNDFVSYAIYRSTSPGTLGDLITTRTDRAATSFIVVGLSPGTTYYFTIRLNRTGGAYGDSNQVSVTTSGALENQLPANVGLNFTADSGIRVSGGSVPCIAQLPSGLYRLFYTYNGEIYSARSTDGRDFTVDPDKRIPKGGAGDPDSDSASSPVLIQFGENSFVLFYEGTSGSAHVVLSATSTDGLNFAKQSGIRYSGGAADGGIVSAFDIVKESGTFLRMYYIGDWSGKNNVRTAVSTDGGNTWTFEQGNICGDDTAGGGPNTFIDPDIVKLPGGGYKLYVKKGMDNIYSFSSTNGLHFIQDSGVRLQASQFAGLGVTELLDPDTLVFADNSMRMFCGAGPTGIVSAFATA